MALLLSGTAASAVTLTQAPRVQMGARQVTVTWKTDVSSSTELAWGPVSASSFAAYPHQSSATGLLGSSHSRTLRRLAPGTWFFRVRSTDGAAPVESAEATFVVPSIDAFPLGDLSFNGAVTAITRLGTTWYVGGSFTAVGGTSGASVAVDMTLGRGLDTDFPEFAGPVSAVVSDGQGGFFVGGTFSTVGGLPLRNAAHLLPDRGVDPDWKPDPGGSVKALGVSGTTVYLAGAFVTANGATVRNRAAAVDATTGALTAWNPDLNDAVNALTVSGSTVYLAGYFTLANGLTVRNRAAAVDASTPLCQGSCRLA